VLTGCLRDNSARNSRLMVRPFQTLALIAAATFVAWPACAQFGSIFGDPPPRPPRDVPMRGGPSADTAPREPLPPPMSLPPSQRPGAGGIESQPLAPPGGATASQPPITPRGAPPPQAPRQQQQQQAAPTQTLPDSPAGQRQPRGTPQQQQAAVDPQQQTDEIIVEPPEQKIANPTAVFSGLDKITGRTITFDVAINETVQFGALQVTPRVCYSRPPTETARTDAFVSVDEVTLQGDVRRIFTGWMFATSPGLNAVEHPIYDVWLSDCKGGQQPAVAEAAQEPPKPQPRQQQRQRTQPQQQPRAQQAPQQPGLAPALR
jgi:hypothetical protein